MLLQHEESPHWLFCVSETPPCLYALPEERFIQGSFSWSDGILPFSLLGSHKRKVQPLPSYSCFTTLVSSISQPVVLKIRHSPWWWGVSNLLGAFWTDCGMIYYTSPPGRGKKGSDLHPQRKYGNYSSEALKKEENSSMIFQLSVIATTHSLSMTQNEHTHAPRVGTIVRCQGLASGYGRNLFHCPLWFWSATIFL